MDTNTKVKMQHMKRIHYSFFSCVETGSEETTHMRIFPEDENNIAEGEGQIKANPHRDHNGLPCIAAGLYYFNSV